MSEDLAELFDALGGAELAEPPKKSRARSGFIWAGIAALLFLLFSKRKAIMTGAKALAFKATVPKDAGPYADVILRVAEEENLSPFLLYAIGARESGWGSYLTPKGPGGTGDYGHGRGLMQIDDRSNQAWLAANDWRDPLVNLRRGVSILKGKMRFLANNFPVPGLTDGKTVTISEKAAATRGIKAGGYKDPRPLSGDLLLRASVAAYNGGEGAVLQSLAAGLDPDTTTAKGPSGRPDYSSDVLARAATLAQKTASV